jgi:lipid-A-disaccharide synthase-like uncharacterized protein
VKPRTFIVMLIALVAVGAIGISLLSPGVESALGDDEPGVKIKVKLAESSRNPTLVRDADGSYRYVLALEDGTSLRLTPEEFSRRLYEEQTSKSFWWRLMNISTPLGMIWVAVGLFGQVLFTGRMIVQWLASERKHRSVVPIEFWWMSLIGATMLLMYFLWRKDIIGVLGQSTGWFIYVRNLWLIYARRMRHRTTGAAPAASAASPGASLAPAPAATDD